MADLSKLRLNGTLYYFKDADARDDIADLVIPTTMSELYNDEGYIKQHFGTCNTAKGTAQKEVTITNVTALETGLTVWVKFTDTNSVANPTLKINNLNATPIMRYGTTAASTSAASAWNAGAVIALTYDGTNFIMNDWNNTTYSSMTTAEITAGTGTTARTITPANLKTAIETWQSVSSVNGDTGAVEIDKIKTTASENNAEYYLIGTATTNTNTSAVAVYNQSPLSFAKTNDLGRLTIGSSSLPGVLRLYSSASSATGYTDLKSGSSSTNTRTITLPDASGTVALTSDIPSISAWALAANKPTYTASEVGAVTSSEVSGMISTAVANVTSFQTSVVSSLPSTGTAGTFYFVSNSGSGDNIYDEYLWINNAWEKIGTLNGNTIDLSGYLKTTDIAAWAKAANKPSYTASEVGALASNTTYVSTFNGQSGAITYTAPVTSVNGQTGAVTLSIPTAYDDTALAARVTALENTAWNRYYTGNSAPSNAIGNNGDLYFQQA